MKVFVLQDGNGAYYKGGELYTYNLNRAFTWQDFDSAEDVCISLNSSQNKWYKVVEKDLK